MPKIKNKKVKIRSFDGLPFDVKVWIGKEKLKDVTIVRYKALLPVYSQHSEARLIIVQCKQDGNERQYLCSENDADINIVAYSRNKTVKLVVKDGEKSVYYKGKLLVDISSVVWELEISDTSHIEIKFI